MVARALCILHDGFEEIEAVTPIDILRRAGVEVLVASASQDTRLTGRSGITLVADGLLGDPDPAEFDALILPGGPAVAALRRDGRAAALARRFADAGRLVAAICAAPLILHDAGILHGTPHTAHHSTDSELADARAGDRTVEHGNILTSRGAGTALDFAMAIARRLAGDATAESVARAIMA